MKIESFESAINNYNSRRSIVASYEFVMRELPELISTFKRYDAALRDITGPDGKWICHTCGGPDKARETLGLTDE